MNFLRVHCTRTVLVLAVTTALFVWLGVIIFVPLQGGSQEKIEFVIASGDGSAKTARLLAEKELIRSRYVFLGYAIFTGKEKSFQAGRYLLSPSMNIPRIVGIFSRGLAESDDVEVTIPEGFNIWEIDRRLAESGLIKTGEFFGLAGQHEGRLFPDTYQLKNQNAKIKGQNLESDLIAELLQKMRENFEVKTDKVFKNLSEEKKKEVIIVASLLEKEVTDPKDMALVAGIIYKRLKLDMKLQIDASVAYGACRKEWEKESLNISKFKNINICDVSQVNLIENIKIDSPYNTYTRAGLPPGAISNPGLAAINAALRPLASDYLYYLSAREDGRTIFSKTAAEHERNRAKYLK